MQLLLNPDVKLLVMSFIDMLTLSRWRQISKSFIPSGIIERYSRHAADAGLQVVNKSQHEASRFWDFANALWQTIGIPLEALHDARVAFPSADEVKECFSVEVHFLGRPACQNIMQSGVLQLSGMTRARGALVDSDATPHERSESFLDLLEKENPDDELLAHAIGVLRTGKWSHEVYHENWRVWHPDDTVAALRFEIHGILGVLLFTEDNALGSSDSPEHSSDSEPCGLPPHVDDELWSD